MSKTLTWAASESARPRSAHLLYLAAAALHAASGVLERLATAQVARKAAAPAPAVVEFHSLHREAGAPEGALYVDGVFVGVIEGVTRL